VESHCDGPVGREHAPPRVDATLRDAEVRVGHDHAEQQQAVGLLDGSSNLWMSRQAEVRADDGYVAVREQAASHERSHHRHVHAARKLGNARLEAESTHFDADHHYRPRRAPQSLHDLVRAGRDGFRVESRLGQALHRRAGLEDHVARQFEIHGTRLRQAGMQHAGDLARRARRVVQRRLVAGDLAIDRELRIEALDLVVQQQAAAALALARRA